MTRPERQDNCPTCGKPVASEEQAGDLAAHLFQSNYCFCRAQGQQNQSNKGPDRYDFCPKCGLKLAKASLPGSLTGYLFQDVRCKCPPEADFAEGAMSGKLWKLKQAGMGTTFANLGQEAKTSAQSHLFSTIDLAEGAIIGGAYQIIEMIGRGGMGEVYLAKHITLGKKCALKLIPPEQVTEIGWRRFQQEAKAIANLDHINLVKVTDLGIHEGCLPFYAMEFVEGETLAEVLARSGPMTFNTAIAVFIQVCDGVDHAHRAGIIHRDLKPANIMVSKTATGKLNVKVLDFGLAKLSQQDREKQSLTAIGDIFGSPFYMSPEQCSGEKIDNRSDIYSIGCTLFECLTGRPPFTGHLSAAIVFSHQEADPPSLASAAPSKSFPEAMEVVVAKLMRKNPVERYQNLIELRGDLEKVARGESVLPFYMSRSKSSAETLVASTKQNQEREASINASQGRFSFRLTKLLAAFFSFAILAGLATIIYIFHNGSSKNRSTSNSVSAKVGLKPTGAAVESDSALIFRDIENSKAWNQPLSDSVFSAGSVPKVAPKSASDFTPYSTLVTEGNHTYRRFKFPDDITIGRIGSSRAAAIGICEVKAAAETSFEPASALIKYPVYFKRFRPGDIYELDLIAELDTNGMIHASINLPGLPLLKGLKIIQANKLDHLSVKIIESCDSLRSLCCNGQAIGADVLSKLPTLKTVSSMRLIDYPSTDAIFSSPSKVANLVGLRLDNCKLSKKGLETLASLPNLERLEITDVLHSNDELAILSKAPRLNVLFIGATVPIDDDTIEIFRSFRMLRELHFESSRHVYKPDSRQRLNRNLPKTRIFF
jgi:serine/threonine protein kinase